MVLRSDRWFDRDDEVGVEHRAAMHAAGHPVTLGNTRPVIGILNSVSEVNPCNLPLRRLAHRVRAGIEEAGGIPVELSTISLGEDLMKPTAMLYRNLMAIEVEESIRANPLDGVVLLGNCDKTLPAQLMGAASANLPALQLSGGYRRPGRFRGEEVGTGTDLWKYWEERRAGRLGDSDWNCLEAALGCSQGACNVMGTALTMAMMSEVLGMMVPGASTLPHDDPRLDERAIETGRQIVARVCDAITPERLLTAEAFALALRTLAAIGGSTNAVVHLCAIAGRRRIPLALDDFDAAAREVPVLADVAPIGRHNIASFDAAGGVQTVLERMWAGAGDDDPNTDDPSTEVPTDGVIRPLTNPVTSLPALVAFRGNLAPDGAVLKAAAARADLLTHTGPAVVFRGYDDMLNRIDDPDLDVTGDSVLILTGCGPRGGDGFPEWGMIPIPKKLSADGVTDMLRISDARMSGTSFGTCVLHVAPEAAVGGPLGAVEDGDLVTIDFDSRRLDVHVADDVLARRLSIRTRRVPVHLRGWPALYEKHVLQAPLGADLDFLVPSDDAAMRFVQPVIGRS